VSSVVEINEEKWAPEQRITKLDEKDFPLGWMVVQLGDVIDVQGGSQPPKSNFVYEPKDGYVRLLQIRDFGDKPLPTYVPRGKVTKFCTKDDVLIARYGASLGRIVTGMEGAYNVALAKTIFDKEFISPRYLLYLLQTPLFQTPIHMISRSAQNGFNKGEINPIQIPIAPLSQQLRIVAEIEKQFSRLDEAVANLKRVKANLQRYKAAVLKAAVEGKLTEEWRKQHPDVEPADKLLKRILAERREKWQGKGKYKEPVGPDTSELPELPAGWVWGCVGLLGDILGGLTKNPKRATLLTKLPYLRVANVYANELRLEEIEQIGVENKELEKLLLQCGDLLIVEGNGSPDQIGRLAIWDGSIDLCVHQNHLIKVRLSEGCLPKLALYWLLSPSGRSLIRYVSSSTSGLYTLSVGKVGRLPVPLPPLVEQHQIVAEVERRLSIVSEAEAQVDTNLRRADRLRQSILKKAFSGKLVPQNPNDEPASMLMKRILGKASARDGKTRGPRRRVGK